MSIKGFISNLWQNTIRIGTTDYKFEQHYASLSGHADEIYGLRTTPKGVGLVASGITLDVAPVIAHTKNHLTITGHSLKTQDFVRFTTGALAGEEAQVVEVIDANTVLVVGLSAAPADGDTLAQLRPVTQTFDLNGNTFVSQAARTVIDQLDNGIEIPTGARAIPDSGSLPLEIVASTAATIFEIQMIHDMGEPCDLFTGAAAAEVFACHLPLTPDEKVTINIPAGSRLSIRHSKTAGIDDATSFYQMNLIG